jgi:chemotaxis protein CheD
MGGRHTLARLSAGIGEIRASRQPDDTITALGLGSCVAIVVADNSIGAVAVAHCMLPVQPAADRRDHLEKPGRYVDAALPHLLSHMRNLGSSCNGLVSALVGGAAMFDFTGPTTLDIGSRNVDTARQVLREYGIALLASDVGGNQGRTVTVQVADATVYVRALGAEKQLVSLRSRAAAQRKVA